MPVIMRGWAIQTSLIPAVPRLLLYVVMATLLPIFLFYLVKPQQQQQQQQSVRFPHREREEPPLSTSTSHQDFAKESKIAPILTHTIQSLSPSLIYEYPPSQLFVYLIRMIIIVSLRCRLEIYSLMLEIILCMVGNKRIMVAQVKPQMPWKILILGLENWTTNIK